MLFKVHLAIKSDPDNLKLPLIAQPSHSEFDLEERAYLGEVMKLKADSFTELTKLRLCQRLDCL